MAESLSQGVHALNDAIMAAQRLDEVQVEAGERSAALLVQLQDWVVVQRLRAELVLSGEPCFEESKRLRRRLEGQRRTLRAWRDLLAELVATLPHEPCLCSVFQGASPSALLGQVDAALADARGRAALQRAAVGRKVAARDELLRSVREVLRAWKLVQRTNKGVPGLVR